MLVFQKNKIQRVGEGDRGIGCISGKSIGCVEGFVKSPAQRRLACAPHGLQRTMMVVMMVMMMMHRCPTPFSSTTTIIGTIAIATAVVGEK